MCKQSKGGQKTVERYGRDHMRAIGSRGGSKTVERYGRDHMSKIGKKGAMELYKRYCLVPFGPNQFVLVSRETGKVIAAR